VVSLPGASADSLARSDPDRTFFRSVARIGLQVAEALEYANRQGVLHRNVKPSNLLLDPKGNVWVADFGLAKAADAENITHSGDIVGTVRYMAPERFAGKCDARSDVYALGLTLYELLALRPAFEASDRHELMQRVMSEEPERLRALVPHLPRDLETIVHKAIDRDPARRYPTAEALAEELQRFLDDKPIKARRITAAEQAWRWTKRNRAVTGLAVGLFLALVAGLAGVTWQWRQAVANLGTAEVANRKAQARFDLAMEAVRAFTTGASEDVLLREKALEGLRSKLLGQSQSFYDKLSVSLKAETDRASRSALAEAMFDAGTLYAKVDTPDKALQAYREVLALRQAMVRERPSDPTARRDLGRTHLALAKSLLSQERLSEAIAELRRARGVLQPLVREHPDDGGARLLEAACGQLEGRTLKLLGQPGEGRQLLEHSKALHEQLIRDNPAYTLPTAADGPTEYRRGLADVLGFLWEDYFDEGLAGEHVILAEERNTVLETLAAGPFATDADRRELGIAYRQKGTALRFIGKLVEGMRDAKRGVAIARRIVDDSPASAFDKIELASALSGLGLGYADTVDGADTRRCCLESLAILRSLTSEQRESSRATMAEISDESWLAENDAVSGRFGVAMGHVRQAVALGERWVRSHPESTRTHSRMGNIWMHLAFIEMSLGLDKEALRDARHVSASLEPIIRTNPRLRDERADASAGSLIEAMVALRSRSPAAAAQAADRAATLLEVLSPPPHPREPLLLGAAHAFFHAVGRPAGPNRPADPPGLVSHADSASARVLEAQRLGYRHPGVTAMVNQLLGGRPELQLLLMDQRFPANPFQPEPDSEDDEPAPDPRRPRS
jgi:tetratricopeptide (TPR) repeat protein